MAELIFHHYPTSPFSEKIRLIFGHKKLAWRSVNIPVIMPKDDVIALTGGYRKTPILQIGNDIYCDTALIADLLESIKPEPTLYPEENGAEARIVAQWADSTLFWTMIPHVMQPAGLRELFGNVPPEHIQAFGADRKAFRGNAPRMMPAEATGALRIYVDRIEAMLSDGRPYLLGPVPTIADFSSYHSLWFIRRAPSMATVLDGRANIGRWIDRVKQIGHGQSTEMSSAEAIEIARTTAPTEHQAEFINTHGIAQGERVMVAATDYGTDPVSGELVISTPNEIAVRRTDARVGTVVVHFPRIGFQVMRAP